MDVKELIKKSIEYLKYSKELFEKNLIVKGYNYLKMGLDILKKLDDDTWKKEIIVK